MNDIKINIRIVDDEIFLSQLKLDELEKEGDPEGFFEIECGEFRYGYYHDNLLSEGEEGVYLVGTWLEEIMKAVEILKNTNYVAIKDTESIDKWLGFSKDPDGCVTIRKMTSNVEKIGVISIEYDYFTVIDNDIGVVEYSTLLKEIKISTESYFNKLNLMNKEYNNTARTKRLEILLNEL